nr:MAG TPA: hypothetical protein [Caudoviricetes sp.]
MKLMHDTKYARESAHVLVPEIELREGAGLYRFTNCNGAERSAIWLGDTEMCWHYREKEQELIDYWEGRKQL